MCFIILIMLISQIADLGVLDEQLEEACTGQFRCKISSLFALIPEL